ncbi:MULTISPECIES: N-acyl-D-amino-acid deacylase family protein [unclassified Sphingomonas]|nr:MULTISPECIES: amidohydrolase family protein [unclassified Sphingomonas]KQX23449.1 amidohydrolase [Sphingomonas sp. Root1294]KQY68300.1 amidohydrolase [Sphingomonas sp. Root50]KRB91199.1 amidohydrolase [Sphingomonas sp. Root720]
MAQADLIIRQGTIVDGHGGEPYVADVAVRSDRIVAIGTLDGWAAEQAIDARGKLVTPGFVDIHTHYDGQVIWEDRLIPSCYHGVTTALMGNCGVGFAPCRAEDRDRLVCLMEGIEDIPEIVMTEGLTWEWETYPEYLDAVERRSHDINIASLLPHSALRVYVMGERAATGAATQDDLDRMAALTREAMAAGALGFGSSRTIFHRSSDGEKAPTLAAGERELKTIATAMKEAGGGIIEIATDYDEGRNVAGEFSLLRRVAGETGQTLMVPTVQFHDTPDAWREVLALMDAANRDGASVKGQVTPRGVGMLFGLELSMHPFILSPAYREIAHLPLPDRLAAMREPARRQRIIEEEPLPPPVPLLASVRQFDRMFVMGARPDYEPSADSSVAAEAARLSLSPAAFAFDVLTAGDGTDTLYLPSSNYADGNLEPVLAMMRHQHTVLGLGDAGAHCGAICDASYPTFMLTHWVRDRTQGERLPLPQVIKALSHDTAAMVGLHDRGVLLPGYKADINIIDHDAMVLHGPRISFDLPAGGRRLTQEATGYVATIVNGRIVYRHGEHSGALPGELIRGRRAAPEARAAMTVGEAIEA